MLKLKDNVATFLTMNVKPCLLNQIIEQAICQNLSNKRRNQNDKLGQI